MDSDLQELEAEMQAMRPAPLNDALLNRLTDVVGDRMRVTPSDLRAIEASSLRLKPAALGGELTERLVGLVDQVPFPVDEKVVLFPGGSSAGDKKSESGSRWWAAAAAVAIAGGVSALMLSPADQEKKMAKSSAMPQAQSGAFMPASFDSGVSDTDDLGVMWADDGKPMRVVRVVYKDTLTLLNREGAEVEVEVPRVQYLMVPEEID